ncbi:hypothetical protein QVD17_31331 [Tagetes erecta]|uniref:Uncharacterized protein n=1 Tax=Tagetes erecta TaxID=13708 RepID=A0AAD8NP82_TARER|nr:hypothetical protein QVD17_31331 [Tagetes erecta]
MNNTLKQYKELEKIFLFPTVRIKPQQNPIYAVSSFNPTVQNSNHFLPVLIITRLLQTLTQSIDHSTLKNYKNAENCTFFRF